MAVNAKQIIRLYDDLASQRQNFDTLWQECTDFVLPFHATVNNRPISAGQRRGQERYDSTAADAAEKLATNLGTTLTNPSQRWFDLVMEEEALNAEEDVGAWLEIVRDLLNTELSRSNFYTRIDEAWLSLVGYGTAAIFTDEKREGIVFDGLRFDSWPAREFVLIENNDGRVDGVLRKFQLTAEQARREFENRPGFRSLGQGVERALQTETRASTEKHSFIHVIRPRSNRNPASLRGDEMPFESCYVAVQDVHVVREWGYQELPMAVGRWRKNADDRGYGRGPGMNAMPDIRSLNELRRLRLKAAGKDVDPPLLIEHKGIIGSVRTSPNGLTYARRGAQATPLTSGARFEVSADERDELKRSVRAMFHADQIETLMGEPTPGMTAFEFSKRIGFMRQLLGSTFGRLQNEILDPCIIRAFGILERNRRFPPPPDVLLDRGGAISIEYVGALARAQRFEEVEAIQSGVSFAAGLVQMTGDPGPMDVIDTNAAQRKVARLLGVPSDVLRDEDAVAELSEQRQMQQEMAGALQEVQQVADIAATPMSPGP